MFTLRQLSLVLPLLASSARAIELDSNSTESIKSAASALAGGIIAAYKAYQQPGAAPGVFSPTVDPYNFGEFGSVWNALISYSHLTGDNQYNDLVTAALKHQMAEVGPGEDFAYFMPTNQTKWLSNDDQTTWALSALTAAEVGWQDPTEGVSWLDVAENVFYWQSQRWDNETCDGGLRWQFITFQPGYDYKNSIANGQFFLLAARLAEATGNETYSEWAQKSFEWNQKAGLISEEWAVFAGTSAKDECNAVNHIQWSVNHGVYTEGAALMYNLTNGADQWKEAVTGFVNASSVFVSTNGTNSALYEVACESSNNCNLDQRSYKGYAARSFSRAAVSAPFAADQLREMLTASAEQAAENCDGEGEELECGFKWTGSNNTKIPVTDEGLGEAFNALEAVQGLLWTQEGLSTGNATSGSGAQNGTATESGGAPQSTGAAGRTSIAVGSVTVAALMAVVGLA